MTPRFARHTLFLFLIALTAQITPLHAQPFEPAGIYLTWAEDPTTTMIIDWHTLAGDDRPLLQYRAEADEAWVDATAERFDYPFSDRSIYRARLSGLLPASEYVFRIGTDGRDYRFRTMPEDLSEPVRFAFGGDLMHEKAFFERVNREALKYDPDFIVIGGDLAYADGREDRVERWYDFFDAYRNTLVTEDGRVVPMVVTLGNHEVMGAYVTNLEPEPSTDEERLAFAPYFFTFFAAPGHPGYHVLDFGDYLSVVLLDSNHINHVEGAQTDWLAGVLEARGHVPHVIPAYHVPAFPSVRTFGGRVSTLVREHWVPLFEAHGVRTVIEAHDHAYKRTYPIRENRIDPNGVVYVGDGAWGVNTREIGGHQDPPEDSWYLARAQSVRHFILMTLHGPHQHMVMIDEEGNVIDEYPRTGLVRARNKSDAAGSE